MMFAIAAIVGPLAGTAVYSVSTTSLWLGCGVLGLASAGMALAAGRRPASVIAPPPATA
jgi:hypothetical protein